MRERSSVTQKEIVEVFQSEKNKQEAENILKDSDKAEDFVRKINKKLQNIPFVGEFLADIPTLCLMVVDYAKGDYKEVPFATMLCIAVALVYFLSPIDLIPDFIPVIGYLDDAAVILFAVNAAHNDIADYKEWKGL